VALAASTGEDSTTLTCPLSYSDNPARLSYIGLTQIASLLKPRFDRLNEAFAPENRQHAAQPHRAGDRLRGCNVRNMNPEKAEGFSFS
jgi:hypothetical protein